MDDFLPYFDHESADVIQVSAGMSGITGALQIADCAYGLELPVTLGGSAGNFHAQLAVCMPNFLTMEIQSVESADNVISTDIKIQNGKAVLGNQPGNGISINHDELEKISKSNPSTHRSLPSPFGRRPGAGLWEYLPTDEEKKAANRPLGTEIYVPPYGDV